MSCRITVAVEWDGTTITVENVLTDYDTEIEGVTRMTDVVELIDDCHARARAALEHQVGRNT